MVLIDSVSYGEVKVDGKIYYSDVVVWWDGKVELVRKTHQFGINELLNMLRKKPEAVIVGIGVDRAVEILDEVPQEMEERGLLFFVESAPNALEVFNGLISEGKKAVAYIHCTS